MENLGRNQLTNFFVYETPAWLYVTASYSKEGDSWRVLKLGRRTAELEVHKDPAVYSQAEVTSLLRQLNDGATCVSPRQELPARSYPPGASPPGASILYRLYLLNE
jgi:hypothetical protein